MGDPRSTLKQGEVFTLGDLLKTVVIASANDSAYAIAEHIAGTPEAMVQLMNERARELGLEKTIFTNVHGLPPGPDQKQDYITAREISVISREIIKHPLLLEWGRTVQDEFRGGKFKLYNTNKLLAHFPGMDGIKTGYHKKAGYNLVASVKRDNLRLLSVVLGAPTQKIRASETRRLLTQGFRVYKKMSFFTGEKPIGKPVDVDHGKEEDRCRQTREIHLPPCQADSQRKDQDARVPSAKLYHGTGEKGARGRQGRSCCQGSGLGQRPFDCHGGSGP